MKVTLLLKEILKSRFDEIFFGWRTVWKLRTFTVITIFWQKFRESNVFTKALIWRNIWVTVNFSFFHTVRKSLCHSVTLEITQFYCHATVFTQKFRQINVLLQNFTINWFDGKKFTWQWISRFSTHTLWKLRNFTLTEKKIRQITYLVISLVKLLISRNFCQKCVIVNSRNFHTTVWKFRKFGLIAIFFRQTE